MTRRIRSLAGIFALLALTFSLAESVWASTCGPMTEMGSEALATSSEAPSGPHFVGNEAHPADRDGSENERDCPFDSPASVQACTGVTSMPASSSGFLVPSPEGTVELFTLETHFDLLLEGALFRPPRA